MRGTMVSAVAALALGGCGATSTLDAVTYYDEIVHPPVLDYGQTTLAPGMGSAGRFVEGVFCAGPYDTIPASVLEPYIDNYQLGANWRSTMTRYGYETTTPARRASNFYVEASIVDADIQACRPPPSRQQVRRSYAGGGAMTVDWSVRASATDEEIYSLQVVGTASESRYQDADLDSLIEAVMADATDRLATDPGFRSLFVNRSDDPLPANLNNTALTGSLFP